MFGFGFGLALALAFAFNKTAILVRFDLWFAAVCGFDRAHTKTEARQSNCF
jgi:hypothetical protein